MSPFARRLLVTTVSTPLAAYALWIAAVGVRPGTLGTTPIACDTNDRCVIDVPTERDGLFGLGCVVTVDYNKITVGKGYKPTLVWKIAPKDPNDRSDYWFTSNDGIVLDPNDQNDPQYDLYDPGYEPNKTHFRWRDRNLRPKGIHFNFKVRVTTGLLWPESVGCRSEDPLIANAGN